MENLFKQQTKSPNILLPILGLSRRNYNDKLSDYSIFLCNISIVINYSLKYKSALFNKLII